MNIGPCPCSACFLSCVLIFSFTPPVFVAAAHRWDDPKTLSRQDRALPSGTGLGSRSGRSPGCGKGAACAPVGSWLLLEPRAGAWVEGGESSAGDPAGFLLKGDRHTWFPLFPAALTGAAGFRPLPSGVHDEVLPGDQGEGGNAEDHWAIRSHWETAGPWRAVWGRRPESWGLAGCSEDTAVLASQLWELFQTSSSEPSP